MIYFTTAQKDDQLVILEKLPFIHILRQSTPRGFKMGLSFSLIIFITFYQNPAFSYTCPIVQAKDFHRPLMTNVSTELFHWDLVEVTVKMTHVPWLMLTLMNLWMAWTLSTEFFSDKCNPNANHNFALVCFSCTLQNKAHHHPQYPHLQKWITYHASIRTLLQNLSKQLYPLSRLVFPHLSFFASLRSIWYSLFIFLILSLSLPEQRRAGKEIPRGCGRLIWRKALNILVIFDLSFCSN